MQEKEFRESKLLEEIWFSAGLGLIYLKRVEGVNPEKTVNMGDSFVQVSTLLALKETFEKVRDCNTLEGVKALLNDKSIPEVLFKRDNFWGDFQRSIEKMKAF